MVRDVDLTAPLPEGLTMIEASAGTGKTYTLVALALRSIVEDDLSMSSLCLVTFTEAATAEMRGRLRSTFAKALEHLLSDHVTHDDAVIDLLGRDPARRGVHIARLERALADLDTAWITTIHGWCARVLATAGLWGGGTDALIHHTDDVDEVLHDLIISRYATSGDLPAPLSRIIETVQARLALPSATLQHVVAQPLDDRATKARRATWATAVERIGRSQEIEQLVDDIVAEIHRRRRHQRRQTFDGLLTDTRALLADPQRVDVVRHLRDRFAVVLVDEFQDTDQIQWDIFRRAFVEPLPGTSNPSVRRMILVGDPKQSIYRFRSAELSAYLAARRQAAGSLQTLRTNWRSDPELLAGLEHLLLDTTFGDDAVRFEPVRAPEGTPPARLHGLDRAALHIRVMDDAPSDRGSLRRAVRADVTSTALRLLDGTVFLDDPRHPDGRRPLQPTDIAVLTRSNAEAALTALDLSAVGLPAATAAASSVLDSEAARQWRVLLTALAQPTRLATARAAAMGWFLGVPLEGLTEEVVRTHDGQDVVELLDTWSHHLNRAGVPALMSAMSAGDWHQRVLGRVDGERQVTDVEHIAELLHASTGGRPVTAAAAIAVIDDLAAAADSRVTADILSRRIDRDDDAVQVMTIHKAKGLEFPVVLCPTLWTSTPRRRGAAHAAVGEQRLIDITSMLSLTEAMKRLVTTVDLKEEDKIERLGEERRVLYVALTRARHHCVVWYPNQDDRTSELGRIMAARGGVQTLAATSGGVLDAVVVPADGPTSPAPMRPEPQAELSAQVAVATRVHDQRWRIWSFSAINATAHDATEAPAGGGVDEVGTNLVTDPIALVEPAAQLHSAPGGTRFGTVVHRVLERCDFANAHPEDHLTELCRHELAHGRLGIEPVALARGLADMLTVPLGGPADLGPLQGLTRRDRLDELDFDLPLGPAELHRLGVLMLGHLEHHDPARRWAQLVVDGVLDARIDGRLTGSIDLVARHGSDGQVWIADYKTNRLGATQGRSMQELHDIMTHANYWLQAALYLVATHRYLRWRRADYDPDRHLIGAAYLFVRGMVPSRPGSGVVWWRPPTAALQAWDHWLTGEVGR